MIGAWVSRLAVSWARHFASTTARARESRWLITHGYTEQAKATIADIEKCVVESTGATLDKPKEPLQIHPRKSFGFELIARAMLGKYRVRSAVVLALMIAQAFLFNAVFFSYGRQSRRDEADNLDRRRGTSDSHNLQ